MMIVDHDNNHHVYSNVYVHAIIINSLIKRHYNSHKRKKVNERDYKRLDVEIHE